LIPHLAGLSSSPLGQSLDSVWSGSNFASRSYQWSEPSSTALKSKSCPTSRALADESIR
jgi:hypothetical protein